MNGNIQMKSKTNFYALIPHFIVFILMMYLFRNFTDVPVVFSAIGHYLLSQSLKAVLAKHQRKGMKYLTIGKYTEAIQEFQLSYSFSMSISGLTNIEHGQCFLKVRLHIAKWLW